MVGWLEAVFAGIGVALFLLGVFCGWQLRKFQRVTQQEPTRPEPELSPVDEVDVGADTEPLPGRHSWEMRQATTHNISPERRQEILKGRTGGHSTEPH